MANLLDDVGAVLDEAARKENGGKAKTGIDLAEMSVAANYSLEGLNIKGNVPLEKLVAAVRRFRNGERRPDVDWPRLNILLHGPSGTGKTAFVRYLAREVDAPLHVVRASDILSKWIGESEKGVAKAFQMAREKNAILFLDEADSFFQSRDGADHSWEVTLTNEFLCQMETFGGCLICSTNYVENLDTAAARRFCFKIGFDYLTDNGKEHFFASYFKTPLATAEKLRLQAIDRLAVADFRTVKERLFYLSDGETNEERLAALEEEVAAKGKVCATIGFNR